MDQHHALPKQENQQLLNIIPKQEAQQLLNPVTLQNVVVQQQQIQPNQIINTTNNNNINNNVNVVNNTIKKKSTTTPPVPLDLTKQADGTAMRVPPFTYAGWNPTTADPAQGRCQNLVGNVEN